MAALNLTQQAKKIVLKDEENKRCNTAFIDGVRQFAMDVRELDIDLIDRINPFISLCDPGKTMSESSLKKIAAVIAGKSKPIDGGGAIWRALKFKQNASVTRYYLLTHGKNVLKVWLMAKKKAEAGNSKFNEEDDALLGELGVEVEVKRLVPIQRTRASNCWFRGDPEAC